MNLSGETGRRDRLDDENRDLRAELAATRSVCREREEELLELKGPCSSPNCALHRAHRGPCNIGKTR